MKASETKFQPIIEGTKQYVVPLFQRSYSWDKREWEMLWDDVKELCENEQLRNHFIGSIVTMPTVSVPEGVSKYLLIDGQQRLTTIFILLALLRDKASEQGNSELADEIQQTMLVNPFKKENDYYKLLPTQADRDSFRALIMKQPLEQDDQVRKCYKYFEKKINQMDIIVLNKVLTSRFSVVSIVLDVDDNPHLVFESLNAKGRQLTQADLIRNYFFMRIHIDDQENIYRQYWFPMQDGLGENLTECIRHYMMRNGSLVKQGDVYFTLKDRVEDKDALKSLAEVAQFAEYYQKLLNPEKEKDTRIRRMIARINRLEVTTAYPFLLNCYHDYTRGNLLAEDFLRLLQMLENFVVRRFVCNVPTSHYNKMFPFLYGWAKENNPSDFVNGVRLELQRREYPKDNLFKTRLIEAKLYGTGERVLKTRLILETLEEQFEHKEKVSFEALTIEHVLPQTPTEWWKQHLGDDWQADYELYLHTLGNLTLTGYNSELSNESFVKKQLHLTQSHIELNKYFQGLQKWDREAIEMRSQFLANLALQCWPYFGDEKPALVATSADEVTGKTPQTLIILGQRMAVESWRDVLSKTLNALIDLEPDNFETIASAYSTFISKNPNGFKHKIQLNNDYYINTYLSAKKIYRFCEQAVELAGLSREDWIVETVE
ncbi:DUF262 domain-containing protein [Candidatus Viridilinea mediisalina]|uniref:DUF262 domain-containing protein n=1 Tax=Candidatus Viridilinea mediisalina TaxID=2024553 RepID=A0A2A6RGC8_9CHLR|nr:DUF262 domain-containing protein [Candidatus Viridilinea mediisalina]PDW01935.1 hypothetical protein CJ255_16590 [Candidatus Viridilinea mediisalina]